MTEEKLMGNERRHKILTWLKESQEPLTGSELAKKTKVSRQVIVQDISLLKAKDEPIIATSRGYVYFQKSEKQKHVQVIACKHDQSGTEQELNLLVDNGVCVRDVIVEHPIYGQITTSLMLNNRRDVQHFIKKVNETGASLLSALTEGIHLHTIESEDQKRLSDACEALKKEGFLIDND
ncbi:transcriptional regulator of NAD metabolism [Pullulanibacillus pueri]|uniref:Transcription repressor NadR n=1 Tax=Pullulanibacillus pueri TaxID=1437324 RepID=A0A8J2ZXU1_9BACL|nr:transcription repressor NadR [Pullulanibacillus pueri]MBM7683279.1 transcriptional regulator of NAD metabolism [Pullulanibacillus pueri]GGH85814.1 transcription repressor NadR [Pullulanibacillus pueri]